MSHDFYGSVVGANSSNLGSTTTAAACSSSRWLTEEVFKLIDIVQRDEAIYNPRHKYYFCRPYVENFWREVDLKLEKNPGASLAKWTNLRISFRREYTNYVEEKVPPCWSYFDRMFFLHPYLRKKHQQPKSLDSQVQDALVQISSLSNRLQRERVAAAAVANSININHNSTRNAALQTPLQRESTTTTTASSSHCFADNYLDYFDADDAPIHSELDEFNDDDEPQAATHSALLNADIKSECEDVVDDYEEHQLAHLHHHQHHHHSHSHLDDMTPPQREDIVDEQEEHERLQNVLHDARDKRDALKRLMRANYYQQDEEEEHEQEVSTLHKRARSEEIICSSVASTVAHNAVAAAASTQRLTNVSFVRPTFSKPMDLVSTTSVGINHAQASSFNSCEPESLSAAASTTTATTPTAAITSSIRPQRMEASTGVATIATAMASTHSVDLCDCKTDPDAMFLMSLLPDIQKLNGRDRGKIKIAFQNILQDYLYPD